MPSKKDGHFGLILACVYSSTNRQGDNQNSVFAYCLCSTLFAYIKQCVKLSSLSCRSSCRWKVWSRL